MTVQECVAKMRELGISISPPRFRAFALQGLYPFANAVRMPSGSVECEIYTKLFEQWVQERGD
jgi:hypothetical protein